MVRSPSAARSRPSPVGSHSTVSHSSRRAPMGSNSRQSGPSPSARSEVIPLLGTEIPLLAARGTGSQGGGGGQKATTAKGGQLSVGSNASDPAPKQGLAAINGAFSQANGGTTVTVNTVDHGTFQDQISSYLQGTPEDVFTWF